MGASLWKELDAEMAAIRSVDRERSQSATLAGQASPTIAAAAGNLHYAFPHLTPGAALALAQAGIPPEADEAKALAQAAAKRKASKGFGWHSLGDVVTGVASAASAVIKPVARTGFAALALPYEALVGIGRDLAGDFGELGVSALWKDRQDDATPVQQTTLGQAVAGKSMGSGYFPGGEARAAQSDAARRTLSVDGMAATPGRVLARIVTEPGTKPYAVLSGLVDFGSTLALDPANAALGHAAKVRKAAKTFVEPADVSTRLALGLVDGAHRPDVVPKLADQWLAGAGRKVVEHLAGEGDAFAIYRRFRGQLDADLAARLADAPDEASVLDVLRPELGITLRDKPQLRTRRRFESVRILGQMPGTHLDLNDVSATAAGFDAFLLNAKMPEEARAVAFGRLARSTTRAERYKIVTEALTDVAANLGTDAAVARRATTLFQNRYAELSRYFVDEVGDNVPVLGAMVDGAGRPLPSPHLLNEYISQALPLPDARAIRRMTANPAIRWAVSTKDGAQRLPLAVLDSAMRDVWKPLTLLRGAWTVRVVGEEQVRMGASGLDSLVRHPLSAVAWATGRKGSFGLTDDFDAFGDASEFAQAMSRRGGGWRDRVAVQGKTVYARGHERFADSWGDELAQLAHDPVAARVAGGFSSNDAVPGGLTGNHVADAKRWFFDGAGRKLAHELAEASGRTELLTDRRVADAYIDSIARRIKVKTGEQGDLMAAVATGRFGDEAISTGPAVSGALREHLASLAAQGVGPDAVKGDLVLSSGVRGTRAGQVADRAVEFMFTSLMSRPTNYLSRSPAFRQFYWQRVDELLPEMTAAAQAEALSMAKAANLGTDAIAFMRARIDLGRTGTLEVGAADDVAKGFALDSTRDLLYSLDTRSQFADVTRLIFPFAEAWKEMMTRWARIGMDNPAVARKFQLGVEGARGSGFFYTDPQTGQEMFAFPGSEFVTEATIGVPVKIGQSVHGLNLFSSNPIMPGFGPVVQVPASKLLPDRPEWDWARSVVLPFGDTTVTDAMLPAWIEKWRTAYDADEDARAFAGTFADTARYLASTGRYDLSTEVGQRALEDDARSAARKVYAFRGAAQFVTPAAPTLDFMALDKTGKVTSQFIMAERFRALQEEDYDTAVARFLDEFGSDNLLAMQAKSTGAGVVSKEGGDWLRANPSVARRFPNTAHYFAPAGEFDITAHGRTLDSGQRRPITPAEFLARANDRVGRMVYANARDHAGPNPNAEQRQWLRDYRAWVAETYPGYGQVPNDRVPLDAQIAELAKAVKHEAIAATPVGEAAAAYLAARDTAIAEAKKLGLVTFASAKSASHLRQWLRDYAATLTAETPAFGELFNRLLDQEMSDDA